jgi:hypothetical protein
MTAVIVPRGFRVLRSAQRSWDAWRDRYGEKNRFTQSQEKEEKALDCPPGRVRNQRGTEGGNGSKAAKRIKAIGAIWAAGWRFPAGAGG